MKVLTAPDRDVPARRFSGPVSLKALFPHASFVGCADLRVAAAAAHSEAVRPHGVFAVIPGTRGHGREWVQQAVARGAVGVLVETPLVDCSVPQCIVRNVRAAYAVLCAALAGEPSRRLKIAGVTGTNGKTSVTWILRSILAAAREASGLLGTIEYADGRTSVPASLTTPDAGEIQQWLARMLDARARFGSMEVSSHALHQDRLAGTALDAAVITNVTQDHFDYHGGYPEYLRCKAQIAGHLVDGGVLFVNADDDGARKAAVLSRARHVVTFGLECDADLRGQIAEESLVGNRFIVRLDGRDEEFFLPLVGRHQISNALAALAVAHRWRIPADCIRTGLARLACVPGRLQPIENSRGVHVFVDYAHTPDALERSLSHLRRLVSGRLICVFGAGGDRDRGKRPLMGRAACQADLAVVTSDNPRSEDPRAIVDDILVGMQGAPVPPHTELDRRTAIHYALSTAQPGDAVLIAGKGHETEQIIGDARHPFDDCRVAREFFAAPSAAVRPVLSPFATT